MVRPGLVRGVNASGEQVWSEAPALSPGSAWVEQVVGDSFGGVVLRTSDGNIGSHSLVRVPGPTSAAPWRWESPYRVENHVAQAPDGTIFVLERSDDGYTFVTGVDGVTGNTRFRHRVPGLTKNTRLNGECLPWLSFESEEGPYTSSAVVGADGAAYLTTKSETRLFNYLPCGSGSGTQQVSVELLRVDANGGMSAQPLHVVNRTLGRGSSHYQIVLDQVLPDDGGGMLATWSINPWAEDAQHLATVVRGSVGLTYARPGGAWVQLMGADGVALGAEWDGMATAFDATSGVVRWSLPAWGQPVAALADGGAAVVTGDGTLVVVDGAGQTDEGVVMPSGELRYWGVGTWLGYDGMTLAGVAGPVIDEALVSFDASTGNPQGQRAPTRPVIATFLPVPWLQDPPVDPLFATSRQLADRLNADLDTQAVWPDTRQGGSSTVDGFLGALSSSTAVVAFVGHSVVIRNDPPGRPPFSVGLRLFDKDLIKLREPLDGPQWTSSRGEASIRREYRLASQARIVFVASCYIGPEFAELWGIAETTPGRMLIVPADQDAQTDLLLGAKVWLSIAMKLSKGETVGQALAFANQDLSEGQRWRRIGGSDDFRLVKRAIQ